MEIETMKHHCCFFTPKYRGETDKKDLIFAISGILKMVDYHHKKHSKTEDIRFGHLRFTLEKSGKKPWVYHL